MKINLETLKKLSNNGKYLTFDIVPHAKIPNTVLADGKTIGEVTLSTYKAFLKWEKALAEKF